MDILMAGLDQDRRELNLFAPSFLRALYLTNARILSNGMINRACQFTTRNVTAVDGQAAYFRYVQACVKR